MMDIDIEVLKRLTGFNDATNSFAVDLLSRELPLAMPTGRGGVTNPYLAVNHDGDQIFNLHNRHIYVTKKDLIAKVEQIEGVEIKNKGLRASINTGAASRVVEALLA